MADRTGLAPTGPTGAAALVDDLPEAWRGDRLGPDVIQEWPDLTMSGRGRTGVRLHGIPPVLATETAWMIRWTTLDGGLVNPGAWSSLTTMLRHGAAAGMDLPPSLTEWHEQQAVMLRWLSMAFHRKNGRTPAPDTVKHWRSISRVPLTALSVRLGELRGAPWWRHDVWMPRVDRRLCGHLAEIEPYESQSVYWNRLIGQAWLREAAKWHFAGRLQAGTMRWSSTIHLARTMGWFSDFLGDRGLDEPALLPDADFTDLKVLAYEYEQWLLVGENRHRRSNRTDWDSGRRTGFQRQALREAMATVRDFYESMHEGAHLAAAELGDSRWQDVPAAHAALWITTARSRRKARTPSDDNLIDDVTMDAFLQRLHVMGAPPDEDVTIDGPGGQRTVRGLDDPQAMRISLLQAMTGRRRSEVTMLDPDPVSTVSGMSDDDGRPVYRLTFAQSKIEGAPDSILVDAAAAAVVAEQQQWAADAWPGTDRRYLFLQKQANRHATKPYASGTYSVQMRRFCEAVDLRDRDGRFADLSRTHQFRHTRLTELAEAGVPVKVLQRYAGHATPTMTLHYVARREEHQEQAFLATRKLRADGSPMQLSLDQHDAINLFDRADRILPNGWCLLPPLKTCERGNACLTCGEFVTDDSHRDTLAEQLAETRRLVEKRKDQFRQRHGSDMPDDNVWLRERRTEIAALERLVAETGDGHTLRGRGTEARTVVITEIIDLTGKARP